MVVAPQEKDLMDCYQHPGTASTATCIACAKPICAECSEEVAGHTMCRPCVAATQERLSAESAATTMETAAPVMAPPAPALTPNADAAAVSAQPAPDMGAGTMSAPPATPPGAPAAQVYRAPVEPCGFVQYVKAILFGLIAGVVGAVIWDKFVFYTHIEFGLIAVLVAVLVGIGVRIGADNRPGVLLPWIGAALAAFAMILGYGLLLQDHLASQSDQGVKQFLALPWLFRLPFLLIGAVQYLFTSPISLIFLAIGVYQGWIIPRRLNQEAGTT